MNNIINTMKDKILSEDDYTFEQDHDIKIKLSDSVLLYNSGHQWKIIPLIVALSYPIIYDKYNLETTTYDITIAICPISLRTTSFKGTFEFETYYEKTMILKEKSTNDLIPIDSGYKIDKKYVIEYNRRSEVKIMTLRSAIIFAPDPKYMVVKKNKGEPIIGIAYYSNSLDYNGNELNSLIHPKTLVYIIQYKSFETDEDKVTILLGKDINKSQVTGYDFRKSKVDEYLSKHDSKILNRSGYVLPCLWYIAKSVYPDAKLVYID